MFFEEDPFDRWCRCVLAYGIFVTRMIEIVIWYQFHHLAIHARHLLFVARLRTSSLCFRMYRRYICFPLMLFGFMKISTWTEVEAYRLRMSIKSGHDLPRPAILEEGLKQEQTQQSL